MNHNRAIAKYLTDVHRVNRQTHVKLRPDNFVEILNYGSEEPKHYNTDYVKHLKKFLNDESVPYKIIIGAYGSGKTSSLVNAVLRDAVLMARCDDGIRRYKVAFIRNTAGQLETTTLNTWLYWTQGLPSPTRVKKPQLTYTYKFNDRDGEIILEVLFLALDREYDISKLDSLELTSAVFNELRHIPERIFDTVLTRIGRYPAKLDFAEKFEKEFGGTFETKEEEMEFFRKWRPYKAKIYADTNPPKHRHWIAELDKKESNNIKVYHQPPALIKNEEGNWMINNDADNLAYVGDNYYLDMIDRGEEFVKVYACGEYGTIVDGKPVYPNYNDSLHCEDDLEIIPEETIYLGCDYGITCPAVVLAQFHGTRMRFFKEFIAEYESIKNLFESSIIPYLTMHAKGCPIVIIGDPADTSSGRQQLMELGFEPEIAATNHVEKRINSVVNALNMLVSGRPRFVISKRGCPMLREGFLGEYHYRRLKIIGEDKFIDQPNKTHPYSDIHDAVQYVVMYICDETGLNELYNRNIPSRQQLYNAYNTRKSKVTGY